MSLERKWSNAKVAVYATVRQFANIQAPYNNQCEVLLILKIIINIPIIWLNLQTE